MEIDRHSISDASASVGCGGWLALVNSNVEEGTLDWETFLVWTEEELAAFALSI